MPDEYSDAPAPVLAAFAVMMPGVELVPIMQIDPKLAELDDWELFLALHRHEESWDGLVTNDDKLLALPKEMTVLSQTNLTLVVAVGEDTTRSVPSACCSATSGISAITRGGIAPRYGSLK